MPEITKINEVSWLEERYEVLEKKEENQTSKDFYNYFAWINKQWEILDAISTRHLSTVELSKMINQIKLDELKKELNTYLFEIKSSEKKLLDFLKIDKDSKIKWVEIWFYWEFEAFPEEFFNSFLWFSKNKLSKKHEFEKVKKWWKYKLIIELWYTKKRAYIKDFFIEEVQK